MIDLLNEEVFTLPTATRYVPNLNGRKPHASTLWRWCRKGVQGIRLEYVKIGGTICTSEEALSRFFNAVAEADEEVVLSSKRHPARLSRSSTKSIQRSSAASESELVKEGL